MGQRRRFAFSPTQKVILWIGGLLCAWQIIQIPTVFDTILNFYAAGAIPGTSIVLEPDTVLHFLLAFFVSCALVVGYVQFGRRPRRKKVSALAASPMVTVAEPAMPISIQPSMARKGLGTAYDAGLRAHDFIVRWSQVAIACGWQVWTICLPKLRTLARSGAWLAGTLGNAVVAVIIWVLAVESALAIWLWQFAEPHIREFDRWLERKVNANPYGVRLVALVSMVARMATNARRRAATRHADRPDTALD